MGPVVRGALLALGPADNAAPHMLRLDNAAIGWITAADDDKVGNYCSSSLLFLNRGDGA